MNSKAKGEISEAIILSKLIELGYSVSLPFGNNQRYDLILDDGARLMKIQCKTGRIRNDCVIFNTCSNNGFTYKKVSYKNQVDYIIVYCFDNNKLYKIPASDLPERGMSLRLIEPKKGSNQSSIRWARDYELSE